MRIVSVTTRLGALPARHKFIAALLALAAASAGCALVLARPQEYTSSTELLYRVPAHANSALPKLPAAEIATQIVRDKLTEGSDAFLDPRLSKNFLIGQDQSSWRKHLAISEIAPSAIRLTWTGHGLQQAEAATAALAAMLTSWEPELPEAQVTDESPVLEQESTIANPERKREEALLRVTVAMLDARMAELSAEVIHAENQQPGMGSDKRTETSEEQTKADLQNVSVRHHDAARRKNKGSPEAEIARLRDQRAIVMRRLIEAKGMDSRASIENHHAPPSPTARSSRDRNSSRRASILREKKRVDVISPAIEKTVNANRSASFVVLQRATKAQPTNSSRLLLGLFGVLVGLVLGLTYTCVAMWRFRPITDVASLTHILPSDVFFVGTIAEINR